MPQISVLVPVYNVAPYLEQCLNSLTGQTFQNIEIICVDDGSTDGSGRILDGHAAVDSRIRVVHKSNSGYGKTMNIALDLAKGDYIAILESDDYAEPDMLQILYEAIVAQETDVVKADYYHYSNGKDVRCGRLNDYPRGKVLELSKRPDILNLADSIWSCLYKRAFIYEHGIRFHETPGASYQDISFAIQVWLHAKSVYLIEKAVLHYRRDNPSASMNNPAKLFCVFDEYEWIEEKFRGIWQDDSLLERYFVAAKYRDYFNHYYRVGIQYQYPLLLRLGESFRMDKEKGRIWQEAFLTAVWQNLWDMSQDLNLFFQKTARNPGDARLDICRFQNESVYEKAFWEKIQGYPQVMVYGAGKIGQRFAKAVMDRGGRVDSFAVSRIGKNPRECMGIPVKEIEEVSGLADTCAVVIAVTERAQFELYQNLERYGFRNIFRVDRIVRQFF